MSSAHGQPGEIVWVSCRNPFENRGSIGKWRPMVLIRRVDGHWRALGLTTRPAFRDGTPRVAIPNPTTIGLRGPGFLWGNGLTNVSVLDVGDHIGWAEDGLIASIEQNVELSALDSASLGWSLSHGTAA